MKSFKFQIQLRDIVLK